MVLGSDCTPVTGHIQWGPGSTIARTPQTLEPLNPSTSKPGTLRPLQNGYLLMCGTPPEPIDTVTWVHTSSCRALRLTSTAKPGTRGQPSPGPPAPTSWDIPGPGTFWSRQVGHPPISLDRTFTDPWGSLGPPPSSPDVGTSDPGRPPLGHFPTGTPRAPARPNSGFPAAHRRPTGGPRHQQEQQDSSHVPGRTPRLLRDRPGPPDTPAMRTPPGGNGAGFFRDTEALPEHGGRSAAAPTLTGTAWAAGRTQLGPAPTGGGGKPREERSLWEAAQRGRAGPSQARRPLEQERGGSRGRPPPGPPGRGDSPEAAERSRGGRAAPVRAV